MKKTITILIAALFAVCVSAETLKVFTSSIGQKNYTSPSSASRTAYSAFLNDNNIDFGYFCGPKATSYFGFSDANYTADNVMYVQSCGGIHVFVYRTADYTLIARSAGTSTGNGKVEYAVVQHKTTGKQYALIIPTGNQFTGKAAYNTPINTEIQNAVAAYPNAKILVGTTAGWCVEYSVVHTYLTSTLGMTGNQADAACGGVYAYPSPALSITETAVDSIDSGFTDTKMCLATVSWRDEVTVTFNDYDGTELKVQNMYQGDDATPPADPSRTGYTFTGWSGSYQNVQQSVTLTAQYSINHYNVTFQDWDGTQIGAVQSVEYCADAVAPADPVRADYRFIGWSPDYHNIQAAVVVVAQYVEAAATTYNVTFVDYDGTTVISQQEIAEGSDATPPNDPVREGYTFDHWSGTYTNVHQDETVTAVYTINKIPVTFKDYDNSVIEVIETDWNTAAVLPANNPTRTGYTFTGWDGNLQNVTEPRIAIATYAINTYTVTFKCANDAVVDVQYIQYLEAAATPTNPVPYETNTVFWKWNIDYSSIVADTDVVAVFASAVVEADDATSLHDALALGLPSVSTVKLTADIDVEGATWSTVNEFRAMLDGDGHTLTGLKNDAVLIDALYGTVRNLTIANVGNGNNISDSVGIIAKNAYGAWFENVIITGCDRKTNKTNGGMGGFVYQTLPNGDVYTVFTNCVLRNSKIRSAFVANAKVGGFTGVSQYTRFLDCVVESDTPDTLSIGDGSSRTGGFVGCSDGNVYLERCYNNAYVYSGMDLPQSGGSGGMIGGNSGGACYMTDCTNTGYIAGLSSLGLGGMVGRTMKASATVTRCVNRGTIRATKFNAMGNSNTGNGVGGFVGGGWGNGGNVNIYDSANFGLVDSYTNAVPAGGFLGHSQAASVAFRNSFNSGTVTGAGSSGGTMGLLDASSLTFENCGNSATVTSTEGAAGGLVGRLRINSNNTSRNFWNSMNAGAVSGAQYAGAAIGTTKHDGNPGSGNSVNLKNCVLGGVVSGGQTGVVNGGIEAASASSMSFTVDAGCRLIENGPAAGYYDQNGAAQYFATPITSITAKNLTDRSVMHLLDNYAATQSWMRWIQGRDCPELSLFGKAYKPGCVVVFW